MSVFEFCSISIIGGMFLAASAYVIGYVIAAILHISKPNLYND